MWVQLTQASFVGAPALVVAAVPVGSAGWVAIVLCALAAVMLATSAGGDAGCLGLLT
jgi:hypothetical protein